MSNWIPIGKLDDIPRLGARLIKSAVHGDIAVFRTADDEVFALRDQCPHKGGPLSQGIVFGKSVACPLHGWTICLQDGTALAPDQGCASSFSVRLEGQQVLLEA